MYYLVYGALYLFSLLPLRVLFLFSDLAYIIIYHVLGYRKRVVMSNLALAFPGKTEAERKKIARRFYRNFTDNFIEVIKLVSASPSFVRAHFTGDFSLVNQLHGEGRRCQLLLAHNFNWELACVGIPVYTKFLFLVVYMPITSKVMDRIFMKFRSRTGAVLLPAGQMRSAILPYRKELYMLGLVADQNPGILENAYWIRFLNKPAPFFKAPESAARKGNTPIVFCKFLKEKRGYYRVVFEMGCSEPASWKEGEVTKHYVRYLERFIHEHPDMWLWSHRRWRWDWKPQYTEILS